MPHPHEHRNERFSNIPSSHKKQLTAENAGIAEKNQELGLETRKSDLSADFADGRR